MTKINLCGVIPPVTTPFDAHGEIEYTSVKAQVDWLVDCGVSGWRQYGRRSYPRG